MMKDITRVFPHFARTPWRGPHEPFIRIYKTGTAEREHYLYSYCVTIELDSLRLRVRGIVVI